MDDQEALEVDSPLEQAVDADDDEIDEVMLGQDGSNAADEKAQQALGSGGGGGGISSDRANIDADKPIHYAAKPKAREQLLQYPNSLPYACESLEQFDKRLDDICHHLVASIEGKDFMLSFMQWNHHLQCLLTLKYPIQRPTLARLIRLYYHVAIQPGLHPMVSETSASMCMTLLGSKKKITIAHLVLPWRPLYDVLHRNLYVKERKVGSKSWVDTYMDLASYAQRCFDPDEGDAMLREMLPNMDGSNINSIIATLGLLVHFLPTSHPQRWLPTLFKLWESYSSSLYDDLMLELCARLAEQHVEDPRISSENSRSETGIFADKLGEPRSRSENRADSGMEDTKTPKPTAMTSEQGIWNDVGIFTESQFAFIMTKCLRSAGLPVGSSKAANAALMAQSSTLRTGVDAAASAGALSMRKPADLSHSFAIIIVYSMMRDSISPAPTPSGAVTPANVEANGDPPMHSPQSRPAETHLAGSKALDALARFVQATESYFHPSNLGIWALPLASLIKNLTWHFSKRWKHEETAECKTPRAYRLTKDMKREFCATLRTVLLLSLFSKHPGSVAASQSSMKRLALLEPDLILPSVLERAYSSLEALETTQRTMSIITALSTLSIPLLSREIYKEGGKHLVPLLHLCIPGIDLNDGVKTVATSIFIIIASTMIKIDDLTRPEIFEEKNADIDEEEEALRLSTAGFEDWAVSFFQRVLALFEALPEEGKGGRVGGRLEEQVVNTLLSACDAVCSAMSEYLFDITFDIVAQHCLSNVSAQSVRVTGALVLSFARNNPVKTLSRMIGPCSRVIRNELEQGASSTRTTSTSKPMASDVTLHWHFSILIGSLTFSAGDAIMAYKDDLLELMAFACEHAKSERGYTYASTLVQRVLVILVSIYPNEQRFVNPDEWNSAEMHANSHKYWGKMYAAKDVNIQWHVPSEAEIAFALEIIDKIIEPRLTVIEQMQENSVARNKVWSNDYCRNLTVARLAFIATNGMILEQELGGGKSTSHSYVDGYEAFKAGPAPIESGFLLKDATDVRYQKVKAFKDHFGRVLHLSAQKAQGSDAEDQIDCVRLLLRSIRTYCTSYAFNSDDHKAHARSTEFYQNMALLYPRQKEYPRIFWVRRAAHHHSSRGRLNSFYRQRSELDDALIYDVTELTMSSYTAIRKSAQNTLEAIVRHYEGTRSLFIDTLLATVRDSHDDDRIKGALYVLGHKDTYQLALRNPDYTEEYLMTLLNAQRHSKPSIQKLLRRTLNDVYARFAEPCTASDRLSMSEVQEACRLLVGEKPTDTIMTSPGRQRALSVSKTDSIWPTLTDRLLSFVQDPSTHWSFSIFGAKFLRTLVRRDMPLRSDVAAYFTSQLRSENPLMRRVSQSAVTKILLLVKLQTLCKTDAEIVLGKIDTLNHPLKRREPMPAVVDDAWRMARLQSFAQEPNESTKLFDKDTPGWLVWSDKQTYYAMPPKSGQLFDWTSKDVLAAIDKELSEEHWEQMLGHFAQEKDRDSLSNETTTLIKSISQIFGISQVDRVKKYLVEYVGERDRHKHRAAAEVVAGMYRGAKHWNQQDARMLWAWLNELMPKILAECTPDSQPAWLQSVGYMLQQRDPRRALPLINLIVKAAYDTFSASQSPWEQAKSHTLLRGILVALEEKFTAWTGDLRRLYRNEFETEFNEVRSLISSNVADMDLLSVAPSFASTDVLVDKLSGMHTPGSLFASAEMTESFDKQLAEIQSTLAQLKKVRVPKSQGTSRYDLLALTTLYWLGVMLRDHRRNAMTVSVIDFIPTIFECCNVNDNAELSQRARRVLIFAVSTTAYDDRLYVERLVRKVLGVIEQSQESWRARLDALPVLQIIYFQNLFYLDAPLVQEIVQALLKLLSDVHLEVRSLASLTLSGIVRCSDRDLLHGLRKQFTLQVLTHGERLPKGRAAPTFQEEMTQFHAGILGAIALISAHPYSVPSWMPSLICDTVARYQDAPDPVGSACKKLAADFKRTHQDTWEEDKAQFSSEQLAEYYEWGGRTDYYA